MEIRRRAQVLTLVGLMIFLISVGVTVSEAAKKGGKMDKRLIGQWSSIGPTGNLMDPSTGAITGSYYNGTWYLFRGDGTFRYVIIGSGSIISGTAVTEGKFTTSGTTISFADCKESWYPAAGRTGQRERYEGKPTTFEPLLYRFESENELKLSSAAEEPSGYADVFYRITQKE